MPLEDDTQNKLMTIHISPAFPGTLAVHDYGSRDAGVKSASDQEMTRPVDSSLSVLGAPSD